MSVRGHAQVCCDAVRCVGMQQPLDRPALAEEEVVVVVEFVVVRWYYRNTLSAP
jgi:hypothetical protein